MRNLVFCFALIVLSPSVFADVVEVKPLKPDAVIKTDATSEAKLFDLDPKRRQVVIASSGVYLIEKQSVKGRLFGKCKAR